MRHLRTAWHRFAASLFLSTILALPANAGTFATHVDYAAGVGPSGVAASDFNGDGKLDLAVANDDPNNGTVSVLLGNGDGTFQPAVSYPVGTYPQAVAVADFNGDGNLDLAVANGDAYSPSVSVLLGKGDGTFAAAVDYPVAQPFFVTVGDFNGDGIPDLATVTGDNSSGALQVLIGNGDGSFQAAMSFSVGVFPHSLAVGDFNGDNKQDVVVANDYSNNLSVLLGKGDGTFQSAVNYDVGGSSFPVSVAVADFNGDKRLDLVVTDIGAAQVSVLLGNGDGTFGTAVNYPTANEPWAIAVGDFNRDGKLDVATSNYENPGNGGSVSGLLGNGDGTFQASRNYVAGAAPESMVAADLNGDIEADLVTGNINAGSVSVLLNTGGTFLGTTSSANPSKVGQPVTFTTTVTASVGTGRNPMGTVTFKDGNVTLGSEPVVSGQASLTTSSLSQGQHTINAHYSGNLSFNANDAPPLTQVVNP